MDPDQPKLGEVLVAAGVISQLELLEALELQKSDPRKPRLGQLLIEKGWATEGEICRALSGQLRLPFVDLRGMTLDPSVVALIPTELATRHQCIAVGVRGEELLVAMADPTNLLAVDDLKTATKRKIKRVVAQPSLISRAIQSYYGIPDAAYWAQVATSRAGAGSPGTVGARPSGRPGAAGWDLPRADPSMRVIQKSVGRSQPTGEYVDVARELLKPASPEILEYTMKKVVEEEAPGEPHPPDEIPDLPPLPQVPPTAEAFREEARRAVEALLADAIRQRASEIRGEPGLEGYSIQFKVGGTYREVMGIPKRLQAATTAYLKQLAGLDVSEHKVEQEGSFATVVEGKEFSSTIKFSPSLNGEKFLMRPSVPPGELLSLEELGLSEDDSKLLKAALGLPRGVILVAAPAGNGKTTTLLAILDFLAQKQRNIQYVGARPDRPLEGAELTEVDHSVGMTYAEAFRTAMRENPRVIVVDDLPDPDVAEQVLVAAMSGRLVVAAIEADDAPSALVKLVEMGADPTKAGTAIALVVSQRIVKRNCERCSSRYTPPVSVLRALGADEADGQWRKGRGCEACGYSGYSGTAAFFQLMPVTDLMKEQMKVQVSQTALMHSASSIGTPTIGEAGLQLAKRGVTTVEEIARVLEVVESKLVACPGCGAAVKAEYVVCPYCSQSLTGGSCAQCGEELKPDWVACPYCGARREGSIPRAGTRPKTSYSTSVGTGDSIYDSGPIPSFSAAASPVLVVDPDDGLRHRAEDILARSGYYVLGASEPEQALRLTVGHRPSLILVAEAPEVGFDASELALRIRRTAQGAAVPIVFMSREAGAVPTEAGESEVLPRPVEEAQLISAVRRHLGAAAST